MTKAIEKEGVAENELLARYVFVKDFVKTDGTYRVDAFMPFRRTELSVTRHIGLADERIWELGEVVARQREKPLRGRGDVRASAFLANKLSVHPDPLEENPNHANVSGWPEDKTDQKEIAIEIMKSVTYLPKPVPDDE